jgi:PEP-CTERM motif
MLRSTSQGEKMVKKYLPWALASLLVSAGLTSPVARADSTLHVGTGAGTACATGCAGDPNLLGSATSVSIYQNSGGPPTLAEPVLVIVGVPNDITNLFTTDPFTGVTAINAYPGGTTTAGTTSFASGGTYGLKNPVVDGFFGDMGSKQEVYSFLKLSLTGVNHSNSFTNWAGADSSISGITATDFGIYVFAVNATLAPKGLINLDLSSSLPVGSIIVAYGQGRSTHGGKTIVFDTPFTESGYKDGRTSTPEPASLVLVGSGLLALACGVRRRLKA